MNEGSTSGSGSSSAQDAPPGQVGAHHEPGRQRCRRPPRRPPRWSPAAGCGRAGRGARSSVSVDQTPSLLGVADDEVGERRREGHRQQRPRRRAGRARAPGRRRRGTGVAGARPPRGVELTEPALLDQLRRPLDVAEPRRVLVGRRAATRERRHALGRPARRRRAGTRRSPRRSTAAPPRSSRNSMNALGLLLLVGRRPARWPTTGSRSEPRSPSRSGGCGSAASGSSARNRSL